MALMKSRHQLQGEFVEVNCAALRGDMKMLPRAIEEKRFDCAHG
jgi:sigma54-dependent transcription regulator